MKKIFLFLISLLLLASCTKSVELTVVNKLDIDRNDEMVEFCLCQVKTKLAMGDVDQIIIMDANNQKVPYQILADGSTVIFQANVKANDSSVYKIEVGEPGSIAAKTFGRQVPERKDDFTWENDRIAFRMYGPALADEGPSNGVDVWLKRTDSLIVNKFYRNELEHEISYHVDNGQGLDCYKVGHTLGAGGIAPFVDSTLWVGNNYSSYKVVENGPLRTVFTLYYDSLNIAGQMVQQTLTVTVDAGTQLNRAGLVYTGDNVVDMPIAAGIVLHDSVDNMMTAAADGFIAYAENAVSDAGVPSGRNYVGVVMYSDITATLVKDNQLLAVTEYTTSRPFTYFFGAGWSKWGFETDQAWFDYMAAAAKKIKSPLRVELK